MRKREALSKTLGGDFCNSGYYSLQLCQGYKNTPPRGIKNSDRVYFLTDKTKIVKNPDKVMCDFSGLSAVISDFEFPNETKKLYPNVEFICEKT